jgi:peptide chain release factor 1
MKVLRSRLSTFEKEKIDRERTENRSKQIGLSLRSDKISKYQTKKGTYNYAQDRITDHRIGLSLHGIEKMIKYGDVEMLEEFSLNLNQEEMILIFNEKFG